MAPLLDRCESRLAGDLMLDRLRRRVRALFRKEALDREMEQEMQFHIDMETAHGIRTGLTPEAARRHAVLSFGGREQYREEGRAARGVGVLDDAVSDLRFALRTLVRTPVFTAVAVATLALGIGANTAMFSVVNGVLLRRLPYADPARLVSVWDGGHSKAEFAGVRDHTGTLDGVAAYMDRVGFSLSGEGDPVHLSGARATAELFDVLGASAALGRGFAAGEDRPGGDHVVVLSHALWQDRFGGDSAIIGRTVELDGETRTVIGVMAAGFWFPRHETKLWVPLRLDPGVRGEYWGSYGHFIVGRLKPGVSRAQARADVHRIAQRLQKENPLWTPDPAYYFRELDVLPLDDRIVQSGSRRLLLVLMGAVGMILLIACANVANLVLARGAAREREFALRAALGAGRGRLVRQVITESLLLGVLGGAAGLALAIGAVQLMRGLLPPDIPRLADVRMSGAVLAFTAGLALLAGVLFGLVPALRLSRSTTPLGEGSVQAGSGRPARRLAGMLVAAEIALSVVLVVGAGLLLRSLARTLGVDPGFRAENLVTALVSPTPARWRDPQEARGFYDQLLERLRGSGDVRDAAVTSQLPFDQTNQVMAMWVDGYTTDPNNLEVFEMRRVSPEFFRTMGVPLLEGRGFTAADRRGGPPVVIVDETAARRYWKGKRAVGGRMHFPWPGWLQVVGVAGTVKNNDLTETPTPAFYVPFDQNPQVSMTVVARARGGTPAAAAAVRSAVKVLNPNVPVSDERTMPQLIRTSASQPRFASLLLLAFALLALVLGAVGTYGLMAYVTERRTREFAVRMALGARPRDVIGGVLRQGAGLAVSGTLGGLVIALGLTRFLRGLLFEVSDTDPLVFIAAPLVLVLVALVASYLPARRATRVDPMGAIRCD
jgi:predicted permease